MIDAGIQELRRLVAEEPSGRNKLALHRAELRAGLKEESIWTFGLIVTNIGDGRYLADLHLDDARDTVLERTIVEELSASALVPIGQWVLVLERTWFVSPLGDCP